jgi:hypothetical protein
MPTGNSLYQRKPGRLAGEKKKVSLTAVYQWATGYTLTARRESIERLKKFLLTNRAG